MDHDATRYCTECDETVWTTREHLVFAADGSYYVRYCVGCGTELVRYLASA